MKKLQLAVKTLALMMLVMAALPNLADAAVDTVKEVLVTNDASRPVPTKAVGTTAVEGSVSIGNTPAVTVANNPGVSLSGTDNLTRSADQNVVTIDDDWQHDGGFLDFERGVFVNDYKTVRYLITRQTFCSTEVEYTVSANMSFGAGRSYVIDQGVIPASGPDNSATGVVELPGNILRIHIRAGTVESPCSGGVVVVGRRN